MAPPCAACSPSASTARVFRPNTFSRPSANDCWYSSPPSVDGVIG